MIFNMLDIFVMYSDYAHYPLLMIKNHGGEIAKGCVKKRFASAFSRNPTLR
jgi:hypothetical protein